MSLSVSPQSPAKSRRLILTGGGTGGHVLAGVAVADAWRNHFGGDSKILFVGAMGGIEERLVPRAGYPLKLLRLGSLKGVGLIKRLRTLILLPLALLRSAWILIQFRPEAVLGVGGYASGPFVLMARLLSPFFKTQVAILEQNAVPGMTNRMLSKFAHQVFVAFPGIEREFVSKQCKVTGNPTRASMVRMPSAARDPFTIFIFGGSQGALGINTLVIESLAELNPRKTSGRHIKWIHQTGERDYERVLKAHQDAGSDARVEKFIYDMPECYGQASLLICRSGSGTLSEIAAVGRASVLIPFPQATDDHQTKNAQIFNEAQAAILMPQASSRGSDLAREVLRLMDHPERLGDMEQAAHRLFMANSAQTIVSNMCKPLL